MAASPAALLRLLFLAVICAAAVAHVAADQGGAVDARVHVATVIAVPGVSVPVSFDALRCFSLPRAARKAAGDVQVWWHGLTGGSTGGGTGGSTGGSKGGGAACKQLKFFANPACKGRALDEVLQPQFAALRKFFHVPRNHLPARHVSSQLHVHANE
ncbi:unnamed protein product [Closterium sp. Naga37s-1]|nr:unnamed protein product [Closterium sp. Naga37s-1]